MAPTEAVATTSWSSSSLSNGTTVARKSSSERSSATPPNMVIARWVWALTNAGIRAWPRRWVTGTPGWRPAISAAPPRSVINPSSSTTVPSTIGSASGLCMVST